MLDLKLKAKIYSNLRNFEYRMNKSKIFSNIAKRETRILKQNIFDQNNPCINPDYFATIIKCLVFSVIDFKIKYIRFFIQIIKLGSSGRIHIS